MQPPNNVAKSRKPRLKTEERKLAVAALAAAGWSQARIAQELGFNQSTISHDLKKLAPTVEVAQSILERAQRKIREVLPVEARVQTYVETLNLAKETKQPAAALATLIRLDHMDGLQTDYERAKTKVHETPQLQPMFALPEGTRIDVTVQLERPAINVTPEDGSSLKET